MLQVTQHLKLSKLGTVSLDGTKIQANASKHAAVSYGRAGEMIAQLELEVQELMTRAASGEPETKDVPEIPAELTQREDRKAALQQARQVIEARAQENRIRRILSGGQTVFSSAIAPTVVPCHRNRLFEVRRAAR